MRHDLPMPLSSTALVLSFLVCPQPGPDPAQFTGSAQPGRQAGGVTFAAPANVPVSAYTGSERGSNSPLGFECKPDQSPGSLPVAP
jgi:hypothetical protein